MSRQSLRIYASLLSQFRNGPQLIRAFRTGSAYDHATTWPGRVLRHPAGVNGFVDVLIEHWVQKSYLGGGFYLPAAGDVVIDAGAHVGLFSIQLSRLCPRLRILALEPSEASFACLQQNLESFDCRGVEAVRMALGGERGSGTMHAARRSLDNTLEIAEAGSGSFEIVRLADAIEMAKAERIALLKMDIEGSEKAVFESVEAESLERIDRLILEYHDNLIPGCLRAVQEALTGSHEMWEEPSELAGCGLLRARHKRLTA